MVANSLDNNRKRLLEAYDRVVKQVATSSFGEVEYKKILEAMIAQCTPKEYGERLREVRKDKEISLEMLCESMNFSKEKYYRITKQALSDIELGRRRRINMKHLCAFAAALDCSEAYLLGFTDDIKRAYTIPIYFIDPKRHENLQKIQEIDPTFLDTFLKTFRKLYSKHPKEYNLFKNTVKQFAEY